MEFGTTKPDPVLGLHGEAFLDGAQAICQAQREKTCPKRKTPFATDSLMPGRGHENKDLHLHKEELPGSPTVNENKGGGRLSEPGSPLESPPKPASRPVHRALLRAREVGWGQTRDCGPWAGDRREGPHEPLWQQLKIIFPGNREMNHLFRACLSKALQPCVLSERSNGQR